ncbi:MerR family transcriptional regulator [Chitinolyticbacter meiyuanensis]|uniref:MerR family transcriptional regulator n=1 Tax=Chitinolyticbacter meiyuanensis TaxID=682798 RepID=UPI0011E5AF9F|nr:helix-turn-helix domain-containing protein [Chitinolyticbacter meiyuanensis]
MASAISIGRLGKAAGVQPETIRYYERIGLLAPPARTASGYRHYDAAAVQRLRFVRRGRELGFSIEEIRTLLQLADHREQPCGQADDLVRQHLAEVAARIADLQALQAALSRLNECSSDNAEHCKLIEALEARQCCGTQAA